MGLLYPRKTYAKRLLERFDMVDSRAVSTPMQPNTYPPRSPEGTEPYELTQYQQITGSLMFLNVCSRPDIAFTTALISQYMSRPSPEHHKVAKWALRFLVGSVESEIFFPYGKPDTGLELTLDVYTDASFAQDPDTRKSMSGYVCLLDNGAVSWSARLQRTVATSTCESEYIAAADAVSHLAWLRTAFTSLRIDVVPRVHVDNNGAIDLTRNMRISTRSKHIDVKHHMIRERYHAKEFQLCYVKTQDNLADLLTKSLVKPTFEKLAQGVMGGYGLV